MRRAEITICDICVALVLFYSLVAAEYCSIFLCKDISPYNLQF